MEASKLPLGSSSSTAAATAPTQMFDSVALQTAYIAAQLQNQLQQSLPTSTTVPKLSTSSYQPLLDGESLSALLSPHLQSCIQQQQQQSRNLLFQNIPLPHHFSAFSPLSGANIAAPLPSMAGTANNSSIPSLDLMLMQMQMATAAVTGMLPPPFNLLSPAAALQLLTSQLRPSQMNSTLTPLSHPTNLSLSASHVGNPVITTTADKINRANNLLQEQSLVTGTSSVAAGLGDDGCSSSCENTTSSIISSTQYSPITRRYHKQLRVNSKRSHDDMSTLRSLCNDNQVTSQAITSTPRKRSKIGLSDEEQKTQSRILNDNPVSATNSRKNKCGKESDTSKTRSGINVDAVPCSRNSPNRHHPINHSPPALEARFLECIAAIALHSNIALPLSDESLSNEIACDSTAKIPRCEDQFDNDKKVLTTSSSPLASQRNFTNDATINTLSYNYRTVPGTNQVELKNENCSDVCEKRQKWPISAIDEELCKALENYKDSDAPMIHAYVIPPISSNPSSSGTPEDMNDTTHSVPSVAVPVPVLNILLDRILQTMLEP